MKTIARLGAALLMGGVAWASRCEPQMTFALEPDWYGGMTVPIDIAGKSMQLLVDTGGVKSMLTESAATGLGLPRHPIFQATVTMYGGTALHEFVRVPQGVIGKTATAPEEFWIMPDRAVPYALSGTIAPDFLSAFDVAFDFAKGEMRLYPPNACPLHDALVLEQDPTHHVIAKVRIDGKAVSAFFDTGASRTDFSYETARRLFGSAMDGAERAHRADAEEGLFTFPFQEIAIGNVTVSHPDLLLVPDTISRRPEDSPRLVLGMNVLRHLQLFIAYRRGRMMVSPAH